MPKQSVKTYILKSDISNFHEEFPMGTIITPIVHDHYCFKVVYGKLREKKGQIADGLDGYIVEDTKKNRETIARVIKKNKELNLAIKKNWKRISNIPDAKLNS